MSGSGFTDWQDVGIFPLQDHEFGVPLEIRQTLVGGRIRRLRDPGSDDPADSLLQVARDHNRGTLGDIHPWWFWQTSDRGIRGMGSWAMSFAAVTVKGGTGGFKGGRTGTPVSPSVVLPVANGAFRSDSRYVDKFPGWPACFPSVPQGATMLAIPATTEGIQSELMLHTDPRLVAVNTEGPGEAGTLVVDLQPEAEFCMDKSSTPGVGGRAARLQSFLRVIAQDTKGGQTMLGPGNVLAWNLSLSSVDKLAGYGLCYARLVPNLQSQKTDIPKAKKKDTRSKKPHDAGPGDGPCEFGKFEKKKADAHGLAFMAHDITYGPFTAGSEGDKHRFGEDADGHEINSGHIHVDGYFFRNQEEDGPLYFEGRYPKAKGGPLQQQVHLGWDPALAHAWTFGSQQGKWRWWADVPYYVPPTGDDIDPPTNKKPRDTVPPKKPDVPTLDPKDPNGPKTPDQPQPPRRGPLTHPRGKPVPPATGDPPKSPHTPSRPRGSTPTTPREPRGGVPLEPTGPPIDVGPPPLDDDWVSETYCQVGRVDAAHRSLFSIHHPTSESFAEMPFRPQLMVQGVPSYVHCAQFDTARFEKDECGTPQVAVFRSWGATTAGGEWEYVDGEGPRALRARGGVAKGGILVTPPQFEMEDYLSSGASSLDVDKETQESCVAFAPGVCVAFGKPLSNGTLAADSIEIYQDIAVATKPLVFAQYSSAPARVSLMSMEQDANGDPRVTFLGGAAVRVPSGADGDRPTTPLVGDIRWNTTSANYEGYNGATWDDLSGGGGGGSTTFIGLTDTPASMGSPYQVPRVDMAGGALEWVDAVNTFSGSGDADKLVRLNSDGELDEGYIPTFSDSTSVVFGTGGDSSIVYDGTDMVIDAAVVGSGVVKFETDVNMQNNRIRNAGVAEVTGTAPTTPPTGMVWLDTASTGTGGGTLNVTSVSGNTTLDTTHTVVLVDASGGAVTITLPAAASHTGRRYFVKKTDSSANAVTVDGNASETIDDATTAGLNFQYESVEIVCDGTEWWVI